MTDLWNNDTPIVELETDMEVPAWIEQDITPCDVAAIIQGGCASGAYMPAVTYHTANKTMAEHGDDVLDFIQETLADLPPPPADSSWSGMACFYLSCAVELWASGIESEIASLTE